jgi:hypothetical protein
MHDEFDQYDYPAAHSMDTTWFAVDKDGFVALMDSSEPGAVPMAFQGDQGGFEFAEAAAAHTGRTLEINKYGIPDPASVGLFGYTCDYVYPPVFSEEGQPLEPLDLPEYDEAIPPYRRDAIPAQPLHVSDLPKELQNELQGLEFKDISFRETEFLQPGLKLPCQFWAREDGELTAVDDDGKIVKVPPAMRPKWSEREEIIKQTSGSDLRPWWKKLFGL